MKIKSIITDIEGTTTAISFVKDTLFKYAYDNCEIFLRDNFEVEEIQTIIQNILSEAMEENYKIEEIEDKIEYVRCISAYVRKLIDEDRKVGPLKVLQGKIWKFAFENKLICGHVFDDVLRNFKAWTERGIKIYIYSSGSIEAQKLLFKYSTSGDLTSYITSYFDTNVGHKQDPASYENILKKITDDGREVLFLSDIPQELYAAQKAGMATLLLVRPNNFPINKEDMSILSVAHNFDEISVIKV